jgi:hypothetical protein
MSVREYSSEHINDHISSGSWRVDGIDASMKSAFVVMVVVEDQAPRHKILTIVAKLELTND